MLLALIGGWGVVFSLNTDAPPAGVGVPGGTLVADSVTPEHMAAMQSGKFGQDERHVLLLYGHGPEGHHH